MGNETVRFPEAAAGGQQTEGLKATLGCPSHGPVPTGSRGAPVSPLPLCGAGGCGYDFRPRTSRGSLSLSCGVAVRESGPTLTPEHLSEVLTTAAKSPFSNKVPRWVPS